MRACVCRKVVVGYWEDEAVQRKMADWMRTAYGVFASRRIKMAVSPDNMRDVAVTEGDKVETQIKFGWSVNTYPVGELVTYIDKVTETEIDARMKLYEEKYTMHTDDVASVRYQAKMEIAMEQFLVQGKFDGFVNHFDDLYGMEQLPGLATQNLTAKGYGFGPEGDWKVAALASVMKHIAQGEDREPRLWRIIRIILLLMARALF